MGRNQWCDRNPWMEAAQISPAYCYCTQKRWAFCSRVWGPRHYAVKRSRLSTAGIVGGGGRRHRRVISALDQQTVDPCRNLDY